MPPPTSSLGCAGVDDRDAAPLARWPDWRRRPISSVRRLRQSQLVLGVTCEPELATTGLKPPSAQQLPERSISLAVDECLRLSRLTRVGARCSWSTSRSRAAAADDRGVSSALGQKARARRLAFRRVLAMLQTSRPALFSLGAQGATSVFRSAGRRLASTPSRRLRPTRNCGTTPCVHMRLGALLSFFSFSPVAFSLGLLRWEDPAFNAPWITPSYLYLNRGTRVLLKRKL